MSITFKKNPGVNIQTDDYTFKSTDIGKYVPGNKASGLTFTIPKHSDDPMPVSAEINGEQYGAGQLTIAAASGVTLHNALPTAKTRARYSVYKIKQVAIDVWTLSGDLASS